ncbi:GNAT family N-acetyltransferase [Pseudomonas entomophila]|uniref:GNAT family N-acetyltransferase n=1 Tax=Pseudomonas entomophila TaxID=312306 RepID=UPI0015E282C6|nr:GNAT family N-acetyltransferase [Pseudomonas entomophila]MBA1192673.1 GNAT family N-acetyltransferase [Pseudomonas entomophila]
MFTLDTPTVADYPALMQLWEASVRATHDFLPEHYRVILRDHVLPKYLPAVTLVACKDQEGRFLGFAGVAQQRLDMLFVAPTHQGQGIGTRLLTHAIETLGVRTLDVNEQNPRALDFYRRHGFEITGRAETDGLGQPYPLLHLRLAGR